MTITVAPQSYVLPDLAAICRWKSSFNPHHDEAAAASSKWVISYGLFSGKKLDFFREGGSELLCSYVHYYADAEKLRTACDFFNLLFVIDTVSDELGSADARKTGDIALKTLQDGGFNDGSLLCKMTKE